MAVVQVVEKTTATVSIIFQETYREVVFPEKALAKFYMEIEGAEPDKQKQLIENHILNNKIKIISGCREGIIEEEDNLTYITGKKNLVESIYNYLQSGEWTEMKGRIDEEVLAKFEIGEEEEE